MEKQSYTSLLNELVDDVRTQLYSRETARPELMGDCSDAFIRLFLRAQKDRYLELHEQGRFNAMFVAVHDKLLDRPIREGGNHFIGEYIPTNGERLILDPTGNQFPTLKQRLDGNYVLPESEYPFDLVKVTNPNVMDQVYKVIGELQRKGII